MRPPLLGHLGKWPTSVIVRQHQDPHKLALIVTVVTGSFPKPIAYAEIGVTVLDEMGKAMPTISVDAEAKMLAPVDHHQIGSYEILVKDDQEIATVELTYQGAKETYRVTEVRGLTDPNHEV